MVLLNKGEDRERRSVSEGTFHIRLLLDQFGEEGGCEGGITNARTNFGKKVKRTARKQRLVVGGPRETLRNSGDAGRAAKCTRVGLWELSSRGIDSCVSGEGSGRAWLKITTSFEKGGGLNHKIKSEGGWSPN